MKFSLRSFVILGILCLVLVIPAAVSASQQTMTLVSDAGTQSAGYTTANPVASPLLPANYGGAWQPAVPSTDIATTWYNYDGTKAPFSGSGAVWISSAATREGRSSEDQWRLFRQDFTLPAGATIDSAQIAYTADNAVTVYLNGVPIATTTTVYDVSPPDNQYYKNYYTTGFTPQAGSNSLQFVVRNLKSGVTSFNPSSLLYKATITYTVNDIPAPEFPSTFVPITMIIGLLGTVLFIQRTREN